MARRVGRRKSPKREVHQEKEIEKTEGGVFNRKTMIMLGKFFNKGVISRLSSPLARGKESDIFIAEAGDAEVLGGAEYVILKMFRVTTTSFRNMSPYLEGDPRFTRQVGKSRERIIETWCRKELGNLEIAERAGVSVPRPYMSNGTILAMEFIHDRNMVPAARLADAKLADPKKVAQAVINDAKKLYKAGLVHADLSEYNILIGDGDKEYLIDFGQAVVVQHPNAYDFLQRDIEHIVKFFNKKYGLGIDWRETYGQIVQEA